MAGVTGQPGEVRRQALDADRGRAATALDAGSRCRVRPASSTHSRSGEAQMEVVELIGKTFERVERHDDDIRFISADGSYYLLHHWQECCEDVRIEDIEGELEWLAGSPILRAEEAKSASGDPEPVADPRPADDVSFENRSYTWTFYKFATIKGYVDIRWFGSSNGYYGESVDFEFVTAST